MKQIGDKVMTPVERSRRWRANKRAKETPGSQSPHQLRMRAAYERKGMFDIHGMSNTPIYRQWAAMIRRCTNPRQKDWQYYGGRGITFHPPWRDFVVFYRDMGPTWQSGLTLDRIDNNGNYEPGNCAWRTRKEQMSNTRHNHMVDTPWGRITLGEASERSGIHRTTIYSRIKAGKGMFG